MVRPSDNPTLGDMYHHEILTVPTSIPCPSPLNAARDRSRAYCKHVCSICVQANLTSTTHLFTPVLRDREVSLEMRPAKLGRQAPTLDSNLESWRLLCS